MPISSEERKAASIKILQEQQVPFIEHLPPIGDISELRRRSPEQIAARAVCSLMTIQVACDYLQQEDAKAVKKSISFFKKLLRQFGVSKHLTPMEKRIFSGFFSQQEAIDASWRYESYWVLLWALGLVEELSYPSETCDCTFAMEAVSGCGDMQQFLTGVKLRSMEEIADMADLTYRYDWACVDARIHNRPAPAGLDCGVVVERHKAFSWLLDFMGTDDWDSPQINT